MVNTSHSRSVRGTLSHSSSSQPPPSLSDATSLTPENGSIPLPPHDSAPPPSPSQPPTTTSSPSSPATSAPPEAPTPSTPYRTLGTAAGGPDKRAVGNRAEAAAEGTAGDVAVQRKGKGDGEEEEVHRRRVRATLPNQKRQGSAHKTMLRDPPCLTGEGEEKRMDTGTETERVRKRESESKL
ncbi:hypothetical protein COCC4DRAFT_138087 [Bipolaris maydis ATCC 48331]|uniref:Uncharacterized protein n=2 Tax=Cochliobolus heterostrophus TaxID=5016 RepID=M2UMK4_COCH5|nr:uncharacterized protein COCC4DRAFT_138087 [Bipolaris maydis ATCC 48331]EMD89177.1 hypothetical protein COCHEDRAFT_1032248 [Bipolaris maydis C5]KAJ5024838.1 hypothetical protein J3E73DRAFT_258720 [Bipolaris maydis]ENI05104.1 hypothetical protein COCC4DRAFT_138087 [Bipolaris maydis ATCC 48331]KAJ6194410.1 hypothetical protein J3E72DRAFT_378024 [Bipolaris maydis]KAJ6212542.1 hypothetical protein PSV09DRAFT_1032248 [Bipolaris maydis]